MKRKNFFLLIALMGFSLIGIISVQWYYISNSIEIKEKQFDQLVISSLNEVVAALEEKESALFIEDHLTSPSQNTVVFNGKGEHIVWESSNMNAIHLEDSGGNKDVQISIEAISDETDKHKITTKKKVIINNKVVSEDVEVKLEEVLENRFDDVIVKMVKEFKRRDSPIEHLIGETNLDSLFTTKLMDYGINSPYQFGVSAGDSLLTNYSSVNYDGSGKYRVPLFKYDINAEPAYLSLQFDYKNDFVMKSLWLIILASIVFTLIILFSFLGAIYYMLKQKKLSDIKNDFISNMTHEFKTPISTISLAADSITHPEIINNNEQVTYYANIIKSENKRMNHQVEHVLNTSLAEKNELVLHKEKTTLTDLLRKVEERMQLKIESEKATLTIDNKLENTIINADTNHLQNALCNLIENALKYTKEAPIIKLTCDESNNSKMVEIHVSDNGIGMNKETQSKIFNKFYRAQTGNIHSTKGFGIGLSYVKAIINAHDGEISVQSKVNSGSTFTIKIPCLNE